MRCAGAGGAEQEMPVAALANRLIGFGLHPGMLEGHGTNAQPTSPPPYMAGVAEVEVDKATGKVTVTDYAAVVDCGTVINPALARVQAEGGIAQGIGMALTEQVSRDERGNLRTGDLMTYKLPTRMDVPEPRVEFMPSFEPTGPFGAKSIGEVVINTPSPAVMSAVAHATGRYVRDLPITPSKVLLGGVAAAAGGETARERADAQPGIVGNPRPRIGLRMRGRGFLVMVRSFPRRRI